MVLLAREIGVESDGDLFKMQQEAIKRAKETSMLSHFNDSSSHQTEIKEKCEIPLHKKSLLFGGESPFSNILKNLKTDDLLLLALLFLLINEEAEDDIILIILFLLFTGMK